MYPGEPHPGMDALLAEQLLGQELILKLGLTDGVLARIDDVCHG
jgi:hypothetical protein